MSKIMRAFLCLKESFLDEQQHPLKYNYGEMTSVTWQNFKRIMHCNLKIIRLLFFLFKKASPCLLLHSQVNKFKLHLRLKKALVGKKDKK